MTLEGADEEIVVAKQRGPRSIVAIHRKRTTPTHADSACPGTADLARFIHLLRLINEHCPWANKSFGVNDSILKELVSNHLNLIVGQKQFPRFLVGELTVRYGSPRLFQID